MWSLQNTWAGVYVKINVYGERVCKEREVGGETYGGVQQQGTQPSRDQLMHALLQHAATY